MIVRQTIAFKVCLTIKSLYKAMYSIFQKCTNQWEILAQSRQNPYFHLFKYRKYIKWSFCLYVLDKRPPVLPANMSFLSFCSLMCSLNRNALPPLNQYLGNVYWYPWKQSQPQAQLTLFPTKINAYFNAKAEVFEIGARFEFFLWREIINKCWARERVNRWQEGI